MDVCTEQLALRPASVRVSLAARREGCNPAHGERVKREDKRGEEPGTLLALLYRPHGDLCALQRKKRKKMKQRKKKKKKKTEKKKKKRKKVWSADYKALLSLHGVYKVCMYACACVHMHMLVQCSSASFKLYFMCQAIHTSHSSNKSKDFKKSNDPDPQQSLKKRDEINAKFSRMLLWVMGTVASSMLQRRGRARLLKN